MIKMKELEITYEIMQECDGRFRIISQIEYYIYDGFHRIRRAGLDKYTTRQDAQAVINSLLTDWKEKRKWEQWRKKLK